MKPEQLILLPNSQVRVIYDTGQEEVKKARGILMKPWGIKATLEGRKTQTRRIRFDGKPGELVYIREPFTKLTEDHVEKDENPYVYKNNINTEKEIQNYLKADPFFQWKSSIHMPREAGRYWLYIEGVRDERIQDISEEECIKEGINYFGMGIGEWTAKRGFLYQWNKINGNRKDKHGNRLLYSWRDNPLIRVVDYRLFFQGRGVVE